MRLTHHNNNAKPNRPKFLRGQGWLCLAAVIERNDFAVGAVPLLHLLGQRLGHVRLLLDAWFMRAWLIHRALVLQPDFGGSSSFPVALAGSLLVSAAPT